MKYIVYCFRKYVNNFKVFKDFFLNLLGNIIVLAVTQLFLLPRLSVYFNSDIFGSISSVYGINTVIIVLTGDSLANLRLIHYNKNGINFGILSLYYSILFSFIASLLLFLAYGHYLSLTDIILFAITTSVMSFLEYGIALYRLHLTYYLFLLQNIVVAFGYIIGYFIFIYIIHLWSIIFLTGNLLGLLFFVLKSGVLKDAFSINDKFKGLIKSLFNISYGHVMGSLVMNLDRFLIPILLGMKLLAPFFAASTVSKMFGMLTGPLSDVLLSRLSKMHKKVTIHFVQMLSLLGILIGVVMIIPSYFVSYFIARILYNNMFISYPHMEMLIFLLCIATSLYSVWSIINVLYLLYYKSSFQVYVNSVFIIFYALLSTILSLKFGLIGFAVGYVISVIIGYLYSIILLHSNKLLRNNIN